LGRPRLETLGESKHPTKGKTFYTLNPKQQQTNKQTNKQDTTQIRKADSKGNNNDTHTNSNGRRTDE
jgi:hypothetical protein